MLLRLLLRLLLPLVLAVLGALAAWAVWQRVVQYGLTPTRLFCVQGIGTATTARLIRPLSVKDGAKPTRLIGFWTGQSRSASPRKVFYLLENSKSCSNNLSNFISLLTFQTYACKI